MGNLFLSRGFAVLGVLLLLMVNFMQGQCDDEVSALDNVYGKNARR